MRSCRNVRHSATVSSWPPGLPVAIPGICLDSIIVEQDRSMRMFVEREMAKLGCGRSDPSVTDVMAPTFAANKVTQPQQALSNSLQSST